MRYSALKARQSAAFDAFPCFFAFSNDQFAKGMATLGVADSKELCQSPGGMFYRKSDAPALHSLMESIEAEKTAYLQDPANLKSALIYELANYEYCETYDATPALEALGLVKSELSTAQCEILKAAKAQYLHECNE